MLLVLSAVAHAVPVCSSCAHTDIRQAIEAGETFLELTDAGAYEGFIHDFANRGLVTVTNASGSAWIDGGDGTALIVTGGAQLRLEGVPVVGGGSISMIAVSGAGSLLELDQVDLDCENRGAEYGGAVKVESSAELRMLGGSITSCWADSGGAIWANGSSTVKLSQGAELRDNEALERGGAVFLENGTLHVTDVILASNEAPFGGAIWGTAADIEVKASTFDGNRVTADGGAIGALSSSVLVERARFLDNRAVNTLGGGGAISATSCPTLTITDSTFERGQAALGGAVFADGVDVLTITGTRFWDVLGTMSGGAIEVLAGGASTITDNTFESTRTQGLGGAADFFLAESVTLERNLYCSPRADLGGALSFSSSCFASDCRIANERIHDAGAPTGGALYVDLGSQIEASHLTVLEPVPLQGGSVAAVDALSDLTLRRSVVHGARDTVFSMPPSSASLVLDEVNIDLSDGATVPSALGATTEATFLLGSADPRTLPCDGVEFRLHPDSPLADLGAYEGPRRHEGFWTTDDDADGVPYAYDCADEDRPTVGGLLPELCDNGVDDDCDGEIDEDGAIALEPWWPDPDGDGYAATDAEPSTSCQLPDHAITDPARLLDCGEDDPARFPGANEIVDDGVDQDCDGVDARSFVTGGGGCGCDSAGGAGPLWLLVTALLSRRRSGSCRSRA